MYQNFENSNNRDCLAICSNNIGCIYYRQKEYLNSNLFWKNSIGNLGSDNMYLTNDIRAGFREFMIGKGYMKHAI